MTSDSLALKIIDYLNQEFDLALVVTAPPSRQGRGQKKIDNNPIAKKAQQLNIPVIRPAKLGSSSIAQINQAKPDFILVFAYGKIIPLAKFETKEILNVHPSLLPKLRGPAPIRYAILEGLNKTGVSLMKIDQKIDHGPIIDQIEIELKDRETGQSLRNKIKKISLKLLKASLKPYLEGELKAKPQDHRKATFTKMIKKEDGLIDWSEPAEKIERKIRAFNPWPGTYTKINGKIFKIFSAEAKNDKLKLAEVQLEGKKRMSFDDFRRGFKKKLDFSDRIS